MTDQTEFKSNNYIHKILEVLSSNIEGTLYSNLINLYNYVAEFYEVEFIYQLLEIMVSLFQDK